jgi:hypothetical protein
MKIVDATGAALTPKLFITSYREAKKLAPPRFLTLRLHPSLYARLYAIADVPESIQIGPTLGPMGRPIMRVACIKPPLGVNDGVEIVQDDKADPTRMEFLIHGILELVVEHIGEA